MRSLWILPDRSQSGEMQVQEGGQTKRLADVLNLSRLPPSLVLGIPEEVLRRSPREECVYAQLVRMPASAIFCLSLSCGQDKTERLVTLTNVQLLDEGDEPQLPPRSLISNDPHITEGLASLELHLASPEDEINKKIRVMLEAARNMHSFKTFASDRLKSSANKPDWMPARVESTSQTDVFF